MLCAGSPSSNSEVETCSLGIQALTCMAPLWSCGSTRPNGSSCSTQWRRGWGWDRGIGELILQRARHWPADGPNTCTAD